MMRAISRRVAIASVPLVSLLIAALDPTPRAALAVNEFAPPSSAQPRASQVLNKRIQKPRVLRAPDLVGQPIGTARATLESRGLHAGREQSRPTTEQRPGTVLAQDPKPGAPVEPGSAIHLWVAAAPPRGVLVPDLINRPANQAASILEHSGLRLGEQRREESEGPAGTVTRQTPEAGIRVRPGTTVNVAGAIPAPVPPAVPAAPVVPPPPAPTTPRPPEPVALQPEPNPVKPTTPAPPTPPVATPPAVATPPVVVPPPAAVTPPPPLVIQPAPDPRSARWPGRLAWGLGSALLLTAGGAVYYRRATLGTGQQPVTLPTLDFGPHWDTGTQRIGPAGPLRNGSGLRLVSGLEMGTSNIEDDHLVGAAHDTGGLRR